jgi:hypothetical protein
MLGLDLIPIGLAARPGRRLPPDLAIRLKQRAEADTPACVPLKSKTGAEA